MKKDELYTLIQENTGVSKSDIGAVLDALAAVVGDSLEGGNDLTVPHIGKFKTKTRAARTGRNPHTGEAMQISAKTVVDFKVAKALADRVA